ncbi:MAG: type II toxin-antitoxin system PemK/MazF family toxin [Verrucomicrobia bacterium]|nr:type II toxin-antitoxin system PemK/MazF family toxin [Verrucomicrobiota bacterium]
MSFSRNEVVLLPFPFSDLRSNKVRPAVVLGLSAYPGDVFVVPISSRLRQVDFVLEDWRAAGLNVRCGIKSQIAAVEGRLIIKAIGVLSSRDQAALEQRLRAWLLL